MIVKSRLTVAVIVRDEATGREGLGRSVIRLPVKIQDPVASDAVQREAKAAAGIALGSLLTQIERQS